MYIAIFNTRRDTSDFSKNSVRRVQPVPPFQLLNITNLTRQHVDCMCQVLICNSTLELLSCPLSTQFGAMGSVYSGLPIIVALGLPKPYAKPESGANLVL
jgi:hypothetical protein